METGERVQDRKTALAPYLERLGRPQAEPGRPADASPAPALVLGHWEQSAVQAALAADAQGHRGWETLLAEGVALQGKFCSEVDQLQAERAASPEVKETLRQQILLSAAIGLALMQELQREIDRMIVAGNVAQAKKLTGFKHKLGQLVAQIKEQVGGDGLAVARVLAADMVIPLPGAETRKKSAAERLAERDEDPHRPIRLDSRHRLGRIVERERVRSRLKPLLIVFTVAVVAWLILILPRTFRQPLPELTSRDLAFSPAIREVIARPPSLFLVLDAAAWERMSAEQCEVLVRQVGETADGAGYSGAQLRLADGTTVATWSRARGATLVPRSRAGT